MTYNQFERALNSLKAFEKEQDKLKAVLQAISPTGTGAVEFGNQLIDDYIELIEIAMKDECEFVSWFVFENDWGAKKHEAGLAGELTPIETIKDLYDLISKLNKS